MLLLLTWLLIRCLLYGVKKSKEQVKKLIKHIYIYVYIYCHNNAKFFVLLCKHAKKYVSLCGDLLLNAAIYILPVVSEFIRGFGGLKKHFIFEYFDLEHSSQYLERLQFA